MTLDTLKQSFYRVKSGEIKVKSMIPLFLSLVVIPTFVIIVVTFSILFITGSSIEYNGVDIYPGDPMYQTAFYTIMMIMVGLLILSIFPAIIYFFIKPKPYLVWKTSIDGDTICHQTTRRNERLIGPNYVVTLSKLTQSYDVSYRDDVRQQALQETLFWLNLDDKQVTKIKSTNRRLSFQTFDQNKRLRHYYWIHFSNDGQLSYYTEMISYGSYGSNSVKSMNRYRFENMNHANYFTLSPKMNEIIRETNITIN